MAAAARAHGALAIRALAAIAGDAKAPPAARVAAAGKLLERGYGRAAAEPGEDELAGMSDAELDRMLRRHLAEPGADDV